MIQSTAAATASFLKNRPIPRLCYAQFSQPVILLPSGWKDSCLDHVWDKAGCPSAGALYNNTYKSSVRQLKRMQHHLVREKLAKSFSEKKKTGFWSAVKKLKRLPRSRTSVVDGISDPSEIVNIFASNIHNLLNTHSPACRVTMHDTIKSSLSASRYHGIM